MYYIPTDFKISGAIYSGVPQNVYVLPSIILDNPISVSFKYPKQSINIFSGFKSR